MSWVHDGNWLCLNAVGLFPFPFIYYEKANWYHQTYFRYTWPLQRVPTHVLNPPQIPKIQHRSGVHRTCWKLYRGPRQDITSPKSFFPLSNIFLQLEWSFSACEVSVGYLENSGRSSNSAVPNPRNADFDSLHLLLRAIKSAYAAGRLK